MHQRGSNGAVQDEQGNWWYQEPDTGRWLFWNGRDWEPTKYRASPAPPAPPVSSRGFYTPTSQGSGCMGTVLLVVLLGVLVFGGFTLAYLGFFPDVSIPEPAISELTDVLKLGGGGLLITVLGAFTIKGGLKAIRTKRAMVTDEDGFSTEQRGCAAVLTGITQTIFGIAMTLGGFALLALAFFQHLMPWLLGG